MAKKGSKIFIVFIIIFILIAGSLAIAFDIGGVRGLAMSIVGKYFLKGTTPTKSHQEMEIEKEKELLSVEKTKLSALRTDLENYKAQLSSREKEIEEKEAQLMEKEHEVDRLLAKLSGDFEDLKDLIGIYEEMDGEEAAAILSQIEDGDLVLLVFKNLKKEKSAEVLGLMDPKKAADILSRMY